MAVSVWTLSEKGLLRNERACGRDIDLEAGVRMVVAIEEEVLGARR